MRNNEIQIWNTGKAFIIQNTQVRYVFCFCVEDNQERLLKIVKEHGRYRYILCVRDVNKISLFLREKENVEIAYISNCIEDIKKTSIQLEKEAKSWYLILYPLSSPMVLPQLNYLKKVYCAGSSKEDILCDFAWVKDISQQCQKYHYDFSFVQTGNILLKDHKVYKIAKALQKGQAKKANVNYDYHSHQDLFLRLSKSNFRSRFTLQKKDIAYIDEKGLAQIEQHARDFIAKRLSPAKIANDGRQTPMKGHPVFLAQHATGTCCRGCLYQWHHIEAGRQLRKEEEDYVVSVIMEWIEKKYYESKK